MWIYSLFSIRVLKQLSACSKVNCFIQCSVGIQAEKLHKISIKFTSMKFTASFTAHWLLYANKFGLNKSGRLHLFTSYQGMGKEWKVAKEKVWCPLQMIPNKQVKGISFTREVESNGKGQKRKLQLMQDKVALVLSTKQLWHQEQKCTCWYVLWHLLCLWGKGYSCGNTQKSSILSLGK